MRQQTGLPAFTTCRAYSEGKLRPLHHSEGHGDPVRLKVPMRRSGADCSVVVMKWGNAHGAKGGGHLALRSTGERETGGARWCRRKAHPPGACGAASCTPYGDESERTAALDG
jgi:hypothetical protein